MFGNNNQAVQPGNPGSFKAVLDNPNQGQNHVNDYRAALQHGYREYLDTLREWVHEELGLKLSAQVSYNMPMDASVNIGAVDVPECESLGFLDNVDVYRAYSGPAQIAGRNVVSNEMGAEQLKAYAYSIPRLLFSVNRAFAGGINRMVIHGQSYTGKYFESTWPGFTAFQYVFSELWSEKQPSWRTGFPEVLSYIGRAQFLLQRGVERLDLAIYDKASVTQIVHPLYQSTDLSAAGDSFASRCAVLALTTLKASPIATSRTRILRYRKQLCVMVV